ncbi:MAG TPA: glutamyl-tRNA reductase [Thermoanaerobaculia bacterium]|nr:glutamyl-tRNA reductase [Thermoanaerobaculia bacterium]
MSNLTLAGLDYRSAPVSIREGLNVPGEKLGTAISSLRALPGVDGASLLSTCNRVEAIVSARSENVIESVVDWLAARAGTARAELVKHIYILRDADVVKHLFRVASGLDSMIIGEPQIGGQVRSAFLTSVDVGSLNSLLQQMFEQTLHVAKKIRTDTAIGQHAVSIPYAAVELAKKIFGDLRGLRVLLLGAGDMAELTAEHLHQEEVTQVFVANRSHRRAVELAQRFGGQAVHLDAIDEQFQLCDIVIASTAAPHYVIQPTEVQRALRARRMRNLFFIDLSVPRNINPTIAQLEGAYLYNVDDLQNVADRNLQLRHEQAEEAERIVAREVDAFRKRLTAQDAVPTIVELQGRLEEIRTGEFEKYLQRVGPVAAEHRQAIETLTLRMINKILHYPILQLKDAYEEPQERESLRRTVRQIFGLR